MESLLYPQFFLLLHQLLEFSQFCANEGIFLPDIVISLHP